MVHMGPKMTQHNTHLKPYAQPSNQCSAYRFLCQGVTEVISCGSETEWSC